MKPIDQTRFGMPFGNCYEACLASLLELPLNDVPDLGALKTDKDISECTLDDSPPKWEMVLLEWLHSMGVSFYCLKYCKYVVSKLPENALIIVGGLNSNGVSHACIGEKRNEKIEVIHDPNPSRGGLKEFETIDIIAPADPMQIITL